MTSKRRQKKRGAEGPADPLYTTSVRLRKSQGDRLKALAEQRANERGHNKPDMSEMLREALDAWLAKRTGR